MSEHVCCECGRKGATEMASGSGTFGFNMLPEWHVSTWRHKSCLAVANTLIHDLTRELAALRADAERIDWLAAHPREGLIMVDGTNTECVFWGVSARPDIALRDAIDAARKSEGAA